MDNISRDINPESRDFYTEKITGRFDAHEMIGYSLKALLDTTEITHYLNKGSHAVTPDNIFKTQKENVTHLLKNLGDAQRGGNRNNNQMKDNTLNDDSICAHGTCSRIVDAAIKRNRAVKIKEFTPANLTDEFKAAVIDKVRALPDADYGNAITFQGAGHDIKVNVTPQNTLDFTAFDNTNNAVQIPEPFKNILQDVTGELKSRYDYLQPDPRFQLVKKATAISTFEALQWINANEFRRR